MEYFQEIKNSSSVIYHTIAGKITYYLPGKLLVIKCMLWNKQWIFAIPVVTYIIVLADMKICIYMFIIYSTSQNKNTPLSSS